MMKQLYVRMGEEFVSLLPETIPFLSEMMEGSFLCNFHIWTDDNSCYL